MNANRTLVVLATIALAIATLGGPATLGGLAAADDPPGEPVSFHGVAVDTDGEPIPEGTTIVAAVDGEAVDSIPVGEDGVYATDDAMAEKLRTDTAAGDTVTFHLGGVDGPTARETHAIDGSGVFRLDLTFEADSVPGPTPTETGSDDGEPTPAFPAPAPAPAPPAPPEDPPDAEDPEITVTVPIEDAEPDEPGVRVGIDGTTIGEIVFTDSDAAGEVTVEEFGDVPAGLPPLPDGWIAVSVSRLTVPEEQRGQPATLRATVTDEQLEARGVTAEDLTTFRLPDGGDSWERLQTDVTEVDEGYLVEAETPGFSYVAIASQPEEVDGPTPTEEPSASTEEQPTPTGTSDNADDSLNPVVLGVAAVVLVALVAGGAYVVVGRSD